MAEETVQVATEPAPSPIPGHAGVESQLPGQAATVSNMASATGGIAPGNFVETDIDEQLFAFQSEDTALMTIMGKAKAVRVNSPIVQHYMIDEQRSTFLTTEAVAAAAKPQFVLPLGSADQQIPRDHHTLIVHGVDGYEADGATKTPGKWLMLFVTGRDNVTDCPIVRAVNGPRAAKTDQFCTTPAIPAGTKLTLLGNALYETQKEVDPTLIVPQPKEVILQKRGMNQLISDYLKAQKTRTPFADALIAEQQILHFKREGNRTLWMGRPGKMPVDVPKLGPQMVYFTEGIRWQFLRELQATGKWTFEKLIALMKMFYTGEDVPKSCMLLAGKNLLEDLQCIDFSKHPEVTVSVSMNKFGWSVTRIHTVFGDMDIKREPTLDTLGLSNSGALIGEDRLVHYTYSIEHEFSDRVDGQEATRKGILVWDALALKGACHIWIDGEGAAANPGSTVFLMWDSAEAPDAADVVDGAVYYLLCDCPGIHQAAQLGQMWQANKSEETVTWSEYVGLIEASGE